MEIRADLHIHSKYSRATSPNMDLENLNKFAQIKGLNVLATGDFTHPKWVVEMEEKLIENKGLFKLKGAGGDMRFILSTEISSIYKKNGKCYRSHNIIILPSIEAVKNFNKRLVELKCNISSDGRPIVGLDPRKLLEIAMECDPKFMFIPAHIWTPWFSLFGSKSGFNRIEDCFEEYTPFIRACETGLSSDPEMNWLVSQLDNVNLVSNSDCHSPENIARECNVIDSELSYDGLYKVINTPNSDKFLYTVEFYPEEGKYHYDGHLDCNVCFSPKETKSYQGKCPVCGKSLVVGVMNRVMELSDRTLAEAKKMSRVPFKSLIPLKEIISQMLSAGVKSQKVCQYYDSMINLMGNELDILLKKQENNFKKNGFSEIGQMILKMRNNKVEKSPGFDGQYGKIIIK